jgi:Lon protease-like protein
MLEPTAHFLPLFPLDLVVFPGEHLKLHIFEPRYKELIGECRDRGATFGIPPYTDRRLAEYGTLMNLVSVFHVYPDGEMDILTQGVRPFRLREFIRDVPGKLYSVGEVEYFENCDEASPESVGVLLGLSERLCRLLNADPEAIVKDGAALSFRLGQSVGLNAGQKIQLLSMSREGERQAMLIEHLERLIPALESAESVRKKVRGNGHSQKFPKLDI